MKKMLVVTVLLCYSFIAYSQESSYIIENIYEGNYENGFQDEEVELIEYLQKNPIPLRGSSAEALSSIPCISLNDADKIVAFLKTHSGVTYYMIADSLNFSINQEILLEACTSLATGAFDNYKPFVTSRMRSMKYLNPIYGIEKDKFAGSEFNLYQRILLQKDNFSGSFLTDKDLGEKSMADFVSGNIAYTTDDWAVIVGDYSLDIGMGNILWRAMGQSKGVSVIKPAIQLGRGIKAYHSAMDYQFFRGVAASYNLKINSAENLKISAWVASTDRNATIDTSKNIATSIYYSGYYRTATEIQKKYSLNEKAVGGELQFNSDEFTAGISSMYFNYQYPIESSSSKAFPGKDGAFLTGYMNYNINLFTFFTEISKDVKNNIATKIAYQGYFDDFKIAGHFRYYPEMYRSPYGYNFGEFSYAANETGLYSAIFWKPTTWLQESFYIDIFKSNGPTYYVPEETFGFDIFSESLFKLSNKNNLTCRLRMEQKTDSYNKQTIIYNGTKSSVRLEWTKDITSALYCRLRAETCFIDFENVKPSENGYLCFAEVGWQINQPLFISTRAVYFDTDSYSSAIWTYEYMMPGYMYSPGLYGKGIRYYISAKAKILENIVINLRYSLTYKPDETELGSGNLQILDNKDSRIYLQLDMAF